MELRIVSQSLSVLLRCSLPSCPPSLSLYRVLDTVAVERVSVRVVRGGGNTRVSSSRVGHGATDSATSIKGSYVRRVEEIIGRKRKQKKVINRYRTRSVGEGSNAALKGLEPGCGDITRHLPGSSLLGFPQKRIKEPLF